MTDPRRRPVQARSRARVEAILDAADAVFLEVGFSAATTRHVADRAGTSIGSLYRFFPNKEALLVALAERYGEKMKALAAQTTGAPVGPQTLRERVSEGIDRFNALLVAEPGFRTLIENADHPALQPGRAAHDAAIQAMMRASNERLGAADGPEGEAMGAALYTALSALQVLSVSRDDAFRALVLIEAKRMVAAYLGDRLGVDPDAPLVP